METATHTPLRTAAVLPAAGQGKRFGSGENKIWAKIAGRSVLEWTLTAFQNHPAVVSIVLVAGIEELARVRETAAAFSKVAEVVSGGETRTESVKKGLDALAPDIEIALVHDAARPLVSANLIDRVIEATARVGVAVPGLALSDTVKRVDSRGIVRATVPRSAAVDGETLSGLTTVQTPQGARVEILRAAYARFDFAHGEATDESSLIEALGSPVAVVRGDSENIKITRPEDLTFAEHLLMLQQISPLSPLVTIPASNPIGELRTGFGYDVHAFAPPEANRKLFLGGIEIPHEQGLEGHSDADVLLHAVCDALLGAASLGDIGILFPNTDNSFKDISSLKLLSVVGERLRESGWQVVNIDATVVAEAPKLMPHRIAMQETMAACLNLEANRLSVKATTSEKLGFVGRREGMACWAVATIKR